MLDISNEQQDLSSTQYSEREKAVTPELKCGHYIPAADTTF